MTPSELSGGSVAGRLAALALTITVFLGACDRESANNAPDLSGVWSGVASAPMRAIGVPPGFEGPHTGMLAVDITLLETVATVRGSGSFTWTAPPESQVGFLLFESYSESVTLEGLFLSTDSQVELVIDRIDLEDVEPIGYSGVVQSTTITGRMSGMELEDKACCMVEVGAFDLTLTRR